MAVVAALDSHATTSSARTQCRGHRVCSRQVQVEHRGIQQDTEEHSRTQKNMVGHTGKQEGPARTQFMHLVGHSTQWATLWCVKGTKLG